MDAPPVTAPVTREQSSRGGRYTSGARLPSTAMAARIWPVLWAAAPAMDTPKRERKLHRSSRAKGQQPAGEGKGQGHQIAPQQGAQKAAGGQNQQGLPPGQAAKGINGDQIGQSQPQAGQGEENGQRNQPLRHREGQRQGGKHRAAGQPLQG